MPRLMRAGGQHGAAIDLAIGLIARLSNEVARLSLDNARLLRKDLGQTSERLSPNQLQLLLSLVDEAEREAPPSPSPDDRVRCQIGSPRNMLRSSALASRGTRRVRARSAGTVGTIRCP